MDSGQYPYPDADGANRIIVASINAGLASQDPAAHHQIAMVGGGDVHDSAFVMVDHLAFRTASLDDLRAMAEAEGRDPAEIDLAFWAVWYGANQEPIMTDTGERMLLSGSADDIASDIQALRELGCRHLLLQFLRESIEETLDAITEFAEEVRPKADE